MQKLTFVLALTGAAAAFVGCSSQHPAPGADHPAANASAQALVIHQEVDFAVPPERVYEALLDAKQFAAFSGRPAEIAGVPGGSFSLFGNHIIGRNIELVQNQRIVQAWRVVPWPQGVYSIARFDLEPRGTGTHLTFEQTGYPEGLHDHLAEGWETNYWSLIKKNVKP